MQHAIQPDEAADLAEYIGLVREHVGISQAELARRTGIDQATVTGAALSHCFNTSGASW